MLVGVFFARFAAAACAERVFSSVFQAAQVAELSCGS